jgi:hypothetical protein
MLPREDRGRRHHHALPARLHRDQQRHQRHQRLARAHVALQQAAHPGVGGHVGLDLAMARAAHPSAKTAAMSAPSGAIRHRPCVANPFCRRRDWRASASVSWCAINSS